MSRIIVKLFQVPRTMASHISKKVQASLKKETQIVLWKYLTDDSNLSIHEWIIVTRS